METNLLYWYYRIDLPSVNAWQSFVPSEIHQTLKTNIYLNSENKQNSSQGRVIEY